MKFVCADELMGLFLNKFFDLCLLTSFENRHRIAEDSIEQQRIV